MSSHPVQVVAVTGGKGGVGKTNVSINLSLALAQLQKRVMLLDADLGLANIDVLLGIRANKTITKKSCCFEKVHKTIKLTIIDINRVVVLAWKKHRCGLAVPHDIDKPKKINLTWL